MAEGQTLTLRLQSALSERLDALASRTGRTPIELAEEALAEYLSVQEWQIAAIEEAIREVDAVAPMVEQEAVVTWLKSWGTDEELPPPR